MPTTKSRTSRSTRSHPPQPHDVATVMLGWLGLELVSCTNLQTLWAGYGHICAVAARPIAGDDRGRSLPTRLILKLISPPRSNGDEGHLRKILSYEVEQHFYAAVAPHLAGDVAVAQCLASTYTMDGREGAEQLAGVTAMLLTDLRPTYPVAGEKRGTLDARQVHAAITWLANLHGGSRGARTRKDLDAYLLPPLLETERREKGNGGSKLWLNGGYTYLATRQKELADLQADTRSEWSSAFCTPHDGLTIVEAAARFLTPRGRPIESTIHGDVKSENLFASAAGDAVAFFDFQYVGIGLGVCDLAKLFTCSVPLGMLVGDGKRVRDIPHVLPMAHGERTLLETYRTLLLQRAAETRPNGPDATYPWDDLVRHWETALVDWCRFQASWGFWGNEEWLEARVRSILADQGWRTWLRDELATLG